MRKVAIAAALSALLGPSTVMAEPTALKSADGKDLLEAPLTGLSLVILRDSRRNGDPNQRVASVQENWLYCTPVDNSLYVVPKTYATDFASVPWYGRMAFPQFGQWAEASVIHDFLYDVGETGKRDYADKVFKKAIEERTGKPGFTSFAMYWAVRLGGGKPYKEANERTAEWGKLFLSATGNAVPPPYPQPPTAVWRTQQNCARMNDPNEVKKLLDEYADEFAQGRLPQQRP